MSLDNEMERVGKIIASDRDLKIDVRGVDAYSVPGRVVLPAIEKFDWLGANAKRMLHGLLDHECAHAKYTDHSQMAVAHRLGGQALGKLLNSIEDGWIEKRIGLDYPGARQNLDQKNRWFWTSETWQAKFAKKDEWGAFVVALTMVLRGTVTIDDIRTKRPDTAKMLDEIPTWIRKAQACTSSKAALGIAKGVFDHFTKDPPPPPPPTPPPPPEEDEEESEEEGEGGDSEPGEDESEEGDEGAEEEGEGDEPGEAPASPEDGEEEPSEGEGEGEGGEPDSEPPEGSGEEGEGEGDGDGEEEDGEPEEEGKPRAGMKIRLKDWKPSGSLSPEDEIKAIIDAKIENGDLPYIVFSHDYDHERDFYLDPPEKFPKVDSIEAVLADAHAAGDALASAFEAALRARRDKHPVAGADEGEVDESMLAEFAVGAADVDTIFRQWIAEDDRDVAVGILVDCSGSMHSKSALARRSAAAISLALTRCQIAHEITGFTTIDDTDTDHLWFKDRRDPTAAKFRAMRAALVEAQKHGRDPNTFAREWRHGGLMSPAYAVFKSYDVDNLKGLMMAHGIAENLDGEAVLWQARRLALRPEPRRVMFVLSDGWPAGHKPHADGQGYLRETIEQVTEAGIEVYGIGMKSDAVERFYPRSWVAHDMHTLTRIAFGSLVEVLTSARDERACVRI